MYWRKKEEDIFILALREKENAKQALEFIIYVKKLLYIYMVIWFTISPFLRFTNIYLFLIFHTVSIIINLNNDVISYILALKKINGIKITNNLNGDELNTIKVLCKSVIIDFELNSNYFNYKDTN
jgi:hypothetical protein